MLPSIFEGTFVAQGEENSPLPLPLPVLCLQLQSGWSCCHLPAGHSLSSASQPSDWRPGRGDACTLGHPKHTAHGRFSSLFPLNRSVLHFYLPQLHRIPSATSAAEVTSVK